MPASTRVDLEIDTSDVDAVRQLRAATCIPAFGGINLEDIKAPECFIIEQRLRELLDIPVFHDDQHGTAIIATAALLNALDLTGRDLKSIKMVVNGAGAASIACVELLKSMGLPHDNVILCDTKGVIYQGRREGMNQWKSAHAVETKKRTLAEAMEGADVFFGLSAKGAVTKEMVKAMAPRPMIAAMANPDPEITPEEVRAVRTDAIMCTGRSDYPNQINNVLGFPYIFRGALDVRASTINEAMKIAAAKALAELAREDVPDEVAAAYSGQRLRYGPDYIVPTPFDPRLIWAVPSAVAKAAMDSGVARKPIADIAAYRNRPQGPARSGGGEPRSASSRRCAPIPSASSSPRARRRRRSAPRSLSASSGYGTPVLIGREERIRETMRSMGLGQAARELEIHNARLSQANQAYTDFLYARWQRHGALYRDCQRMVNQDRNVFAACMVACGDADALVTGTTRNYFTAFEQVARVIGAKPKQPRLRLCPAAVARPLGDDRRHHRPCAAFGRRARRHRDAVRREGAQDAGPGAARGAALDLEFRQSRRRWRRAACAPRWRLLDARQVDFEYDGEMSAEVALNRALMRERYPFCRLSAPANVLIMPGLDTANLASQLLEQLGGGKRIGPLVMGLDKPAQIVEMGATVSDLVNLAALAAHRGPRLTRLAPFILATCSARWCCRRRPCWR